MRTISKDKSTKTAANNVMDVQDKQLNRHIHDLFLLNEKKKEADREYNKARKDLLDEMNSLRIKSKKVRLSDGRVFEAKIEATTRDIIDVEKFSALVDKKTFILCASVTKTEAKKHVAGSLVEECCTTVIGEENVSVKKIEE